MRGPAVFREYWRRPQATVEAFTSDGWFRTGDTVLLESGSDGGETYRILGRSSVDILKTGGYKVSALEIEAVLRDHPAIHDCAVVGLDDPEWGQRIAAAAVLEPAATLTAEELREWARERLAPYKLPRQLLAVDELPRNALGKVQKPKLVGLFPRCGLLGQYQLPELRAMSDSSQYRKHLAVLDGYLDKALECARRSGVDVGGVLFHAGREAKYHADDQVIEFRPTAHFRRWVPLDGPEHVVLARPGRTPRVVRVRPKDYWYDTSPPPASYWHDAVDLQEAESFEQAVALLGDLRRVAYAGDSPEAAAKAGIPPDLVEPEALMAPLDWYRAYKTEHEAAQLRRACEKAAAGHRAARDAFTAGATEREIHWAYLRASDQLEVEIPYGTIVALDDKAAILHYQQKRGKEKGAGSILLIDAGAAWEGQASDITRTWARPDTEASFREILDGVDRLERELVAMVTPGRPYLEIHIAAHRKTAELLEATRVLRCTAEEALDRKVTSAFLPHGVGHQLGLQVHDVGGHQAGPEGGTVPPPPAHPFLRNTRVLEPGHCVTIEPGLYFIPMLLEPLRQGDTASLLDWNLIDRLTPLGGIRIEDDILCTDGEPEDLTRDLVEGPRGE